MASIKKVKDDPGPNHLAPSKTGPSAWKIPSFRWKFWTGMMIFAGILIAFPSFFNLLKPGTDILFHDFLLEWLPARNVSVAVFFLIWSCCLILVIRIFVIP